MLEENGMERARRAPMKIEVYGYEAITKTVKPASEKISRVYLPKGWAGKKVKIILLDELDEEEN